MSFATKKAIRRAVRGRISSDLAQQFRIRVQRRGGVCLASVTHRGHGTRILLASAKTWKQAFKQVVSGFMREAA